MKIVQTRTFARAVKKLHSNQKKELDGAIRAIIAGPETGRDKVGDLAGIRVCKIKLVKQPYLLAYTQDVETITLTLLALGVHENFYRDLKRQESK